MLHTEKILLGFRYFWLQHSKQPVPRIGIANPVLLMIERICTSPMVALDPTDQGILYLLQQDARNNTTSGIGEQVGVSSTTVGNRISKLEEKGIVTGYHPTIDYEKAGLDHYLLLTATAPTDKRSQLAEQALNVHGVVTVRELLTHHQNIELEIAASTRKEIEETLNELTDLGLELVRNELLKRELHQPADNFGKEVAED